MEVTPSYANFCAKFESKLSEYEQEHQGSQRKPWTAEKVLEVLNNIKNARLVSNQPKTSMEYYWLSKYDIVEIENEEFLIFKKKSPNDSMVRIIPRNKYFQILEKVHESCGHGGRDKMIHAIKSKYYIPKKAIEIFLAYCPTCETKKHSPKRGIVKQPIISKDSNSRGQVELVDFQLCVDGEYKWLLNYQDNDTKFLSLRPLKTKRAVEVATELFKIFMIFGPPCILQSHNGQEFTAKIIKELAAMWPECNIVNGSPSRGPQTPGSVEGSNQEVEQMLRSWMSENNSTNWALGCYQVQYKTNTSLHHTIGRTPFKALFGKEPKSGLSSSPKSSPNIRNIKSEEPLQNLLEHKSCSENNGVDAGMHFMEHTIFGV